MSQSEGREVKIRVGGEQIVLGELIIPEDASSIVLFSHGSGSSRYSVRNKFVASVLNEHKIATLLVDLLSVEEDSDIENRFNISLLTHRLIDITHWIASAPQLHGFKIGLFGASTGAASALAAAAELPDVIHAVVSRGGRPDLAKTHLNKVKAPTLLIVGAWDEPVIAMNDEAYALLSCIKKMIIVDGATHLFEEPGKLDIVAHLAADWFTKYL